MRTGNIVVYAGLFLLLGFISLSSAAMVTDPTGDAIGPTDITKVRAEQTIRGDGVDVLKVSYTATPNLGGIVVFEADVDSNIDTGGNLSMTGISVSPCPCKTTAGIDVAIIMLNRDQAATSASAICAGCTDSAAGSCATKRRWGEWYAVALYNDYQLNRDTNGVLRGYKDPLPNIDSTTMCYTFPWSMILTYAREAIANPAEQYDYENALDPSTTRWQLSVWTDPAYGTGNQDDFADGTASLNISDWAPNGDSVLVASVDFGDSRTYCEGNFDNDLDIDGLDVAKFKTDFGRSDIFWPCAPCNQNY
jgi:hypothetical protein